MNISDIAIHGHVLAHIEYFLFSPCTPVALFSSNQDLLDLTSLSTRLLFLGILPISALFPNSSMSRSGSLHTGAPSPESCPQMRKICVPRMRTRTGILESMSISGVDHVNRNPFSSFRATENSFFIVCATSLFFMIISILSLRSGQKWMKTSLSSAILVM